MGFLLISRQTKARRPVAGVSGDDFETPRDIQIDLLDYTDQTN
jgi:hypothetical protein